MLAWLQGFLFVFFKIKTYFKPILNGCWYFQYLSLSHWVIKFTSSTSLTGTLYSKQYKTDKQSLSYMCAASFLTSLVLGLSSVTAQLRSFLLGSLLSLGSNTVLQQLFVLLVPLPVTSLHIIHSYIPHLPTFLVISQEAGRHALLFIFAPRPSAWSHRLNLRAATLLSP